MKVFLRRMGNIYTLEMGDDHIVKNGEVISAEIKKPRNYRFLKKYFALLDYAFSIWTPEEVRYKGQIVEKNDEKFRNDIIVLAGFGIPVINIKGEVRFEAKSISFANMDEDEFEKVYSKTIDVILKHVLTNYEREDIDRIIENIIGFD